MSIFKIVSVSIVSLFLSVAAAHADPIQAKNLTQEQIEALRAISKAYGNRLGDQLTVDLKVIEKDEPGLFDDEEFEIAGTFEGAGGEYYFFDETGVDFSTEGQVTFYLSNNDCDDPGCSTYEVEFVFKKNKAGVYFASVSMDVSVDSEDLSAIWEDNKDLPKEELEVLLDKACKEYYGPFASLEGLVDDYKSSVYCRYSKKSILKVTNP